MKTSRMLFAMLLLCVSIQGLFAQTKLDVRFNIAEVDCDNEKLYVDLQAQNPQDAAYFLGSLSLRFTFNPMAVALPDLLEPKMAGTHKVAFRYDVFSYGMLIFEPANTLLPGEWTTIGQVVFDIVDPNMDLDLRWNHPSDYPASTAQEFKDVFEQPDLELRKLQDLETPLTSWCDKTTGIGDVDDIRSLEIFPNPNNGMFDIRIHKSAGDDFQLQITDINGKILLDEQVDTPQKDIIRKMDYSGYASGSYMVKLLTKDEVMIKKLEIIH